MFKVSATFLKRCSVILMFIPLDFRTICNISQRMPDVNLPDLQLQNTRLDVSNLASSQNGLKILKDFIAIDNRNCNSLQELSQKIMGGLNDCNFSVIDNLFEESLTLEIYNEVRFLYDKTDSFHPGQLSQTGSRQAQRTENNRGIRGDFVTWVGFATNPHMTHLLSAVRYIDKIIALMGSSPLLAECNIRSRSSVMVACYPGNGSHYKRHVDNPSKDGRKLTTILYLNKGYIAARDGGMLRIHNPNSSAYYDIFPVFGRLVIFWSDSRTPHEVLPSFRERFAVSVWYFDTKERTEALQSGILHS